MIYFALIFSFWINSFSYAIYASTEFSDDELSVIELAESDSDYYSSEEELSATPKTPQLVNLSGKPPLGPKPVVISTPTPTPTPEVISERRQEKQPEDVSSSYRRLRTPERRRSLLEQMFDLSISRDGIVIPEHQRSMNQQPVVLFNSNTSSPVMSVRDRFTEIRNRAQNKVRVLSVDGGGVRVLTATLMLESFARNGKHPTEMFDIMAGTSTGALLVAMLNVPDELGKPKYNPKYISEWLMRNASDIYARRKSPIGPTYSNVNLIRLLDEVFGNLRMSRLLNPVIIPAFDIAKYTPVLFRSKQPTSLGQYELHKDYLVKDVILAAMSYPTYFPPVTIHSLTEGGFPDENCSFELTDAAPYCDNPTMIAVSYAMQYYGLPNMSDLKILSLMTGIKPQTFYHKDLIGLPKYKWPRPVMGMARKGQNIMTHELTSLATSHPSGEDKSANASYFRPPISLDHATPSQVDASENNLLSLVADTENAIAANPAYYRKIRKEFSYSERRLSEHQGYLNSRLEQLLRTKESIHEEAKHLKLTRSLNLERRPLRVLSIDGGGNRGLIPALWLQQVQKLLGHDVTDHFDVFVGTSTGGVIIAGLNIPDERMEVVSQAYGFENPIDGLVDLYQTRGADIFAPRSRFSIGAKYNHEGLEEILDFFFSDTLMSQLKKPTMVLTYDVGQDNPVLVSSHPTLIDHSMMNYVGYRVKHALRGTSAAPTYFDPAYFKDLKGDTHVMADGGVYANNPCLAGLVYALQLFPTYKMHDIEIVSLSTGWKPTAMDADSVKSWGKIRWAPEIVPMTMSGSSAAAHAIMSELPVRDYYRVEVGLTGSPAMDDISQKNIASLARDAERTFHPTNERFRDFMEKLRRENPADGKYYQQLLSRRTTEADDQ